MRYLFCIQIIYKIYLSYR